MLSDMDLSHFDTMDAAELRSYLAFLLWHYRVVDGFWFLYMTEDYDLPAAERLNERVWARVSRSGHSRSGQPLCDHREGPGGIRQSLAPLSLDRSARIPGRRIAG